MTLLRPWTSGPAAILISTLLGGCGLPTQTETPGHLMSIETVKMDSRTSSPVVLLREDEGKRRLLPIWIGIFEARSIAIAMEEVALPRPNTHDLIRSILDQIGGKLSRVLITELKDNTYYAVLELQLDGRTISIDSRPSDAIAIATRTLTPVYATAEVLQDAGIIPGTGEALEIDAPQPGDDASIHSLLIH